MKKVDKLGRIVIPQSLREKHGLTEGAAIEFLDGHDGVTVRAFGSFCKLCRAKIKDDTKLPLCDACLEKAAKSYTGKS